MRRVDGGPMSRNGRRTVMDAGILHGLWTVAMIAIFAAIVAWAWSGRRKRDFDEAARLPLVGEAERLPAIGEAEHLPLEEEAEAEQGATDPHTEGARHG